MNITIHMYVSLNEFKRLKEGEICFGYSEGYTEYPIHIEVPIECITNVIDLSEFNQEHYEYQVNPRRLEK